MALPIDSLDVELPANLQSNDSPKAKEVKDLKEPKELKEKPRKLPLRRVHTLTLEKQLEQERQARLMLEAEVASLRKLNGLDERPQGLKVQTQMQMHTARLLAGDTLQVVRKQHPFHY